MAAPDAPTLSPLPVDGEVLRTGSPQRLIALSRDAAEFTRVRDFLLGLSLAGNEIVLVWLTGSPKPDLDFAAHRQIRPGLVRSTAALRQLVRTPREHWRGDRDNLLGAIRLDPAVQRLVEWSDGVIAFDEHASAAIEEVVEGRSARVPHKDLRGWAGLGRVWGQFGQAVRAGVYSPAFAREVADRVTLLQPPAPAEVQDELATFLTELTRSGHHREAIRLLPYLAAADEDPIERIRRRAILAYARTSAAGEADPDLHESVTALLPAIDGLLDTDPARAAALTTLALGLLFHVEVHADKLSTPLVADPDGWLAPWRASRVGQLLAAPAPQRPRADPDPVVTPARRVVVFRGSYPRFSAQLVEELEARPEVSVTVADWSSRGSTVRGLGVRPELVEARLRQALGEPVRDEEAEELLGDADAAFIDWADRGALAVLMHVPQGVRVTLRIHSMDALSSWIHLIDWSRVDTLILVSDHLRETVVRLLGDRLADTAIHVVPNSVDTSRIPPEKTPGHRRRLITIGWAQAVKDPVWALEVLALLRREDPTWQLVLVGTDFAPGTVASAASYAASFRERLCAPDVCGGVEFVPATSDIAPLLASTGFVLSSSRRESFGLGLVEGAASGAVPVVRDWPVFASLGGARGLFPAEWVVDSVEAAARRVLALSEETEWERESAAVRAEVARRFLDVAPARLLADLALGVSAD